MSNIWEYFEDLKGFEQNLCGFITINLLGQKVGEVDGMTDGVCEGSEVGVLVGVAP